MLDAQIKQKQQPIKADEIAQVIHTYFSNNGFSGETPLPSLLEVKEAVANEISLNGKTLEQIIIAVSNKFGVKLGPIDREALTEEALKEHPAIAVNHNTAGVIIRKLSNGNVEVKKEPGFAVWSTRRSYHLG